MDANATGSALPPDPGDAVILGSAPSGRSILLGLNAGAIVVAGLYFGRTLLVPLVMASLLAFVLAPVCGVLQRAGLRRVLAVMVAVVLAFGVIGCIGLIVGHQAAMLADSLPSYQATVVDKWHALTANGSLLRRLLVQSAPGVIGNDNSPGLATSMFGFADASSLTLARTLAQPLLGPLATMGVVLVFTVFILLSSEDLRDRLVRLVGRRDLHRTILAMNDAARRLSRYFVFQLGLNTGFGTLIGTSFWLAGLPNPVLWGILAGLMRFVPFIGTFIALVPPLLLAVAAAPGWSLAILVLVLFVCMVMLMGQVVEPLIYGHSTGLSPIAVIVATAFWAFLWGPVGLLLSTPLTVCLVVVGRHVQPLAFLDVVLGDQPPLEPAETFYQRALEGNAAVLVAGARVQVAASSLTDYYDSVALRGLALAQGDLSRDALAFERLEAIHTQFTLLLDQLERSNVHGSTKPPAAWQAAGTILCIPGRGHLDDLAARMSAQVLTVAGFGARTEPNLVLGGSGAVGPDLAGARLCCLSVLEQGSSASSVRYFIRRIQKRMPDAVPVVCLWQAQGDSPLLSALRAEGHGEYLVLSTGELLALAQALANRWAAEPAV